ncbi:MAG TPA: phospholipase C, phosphocholine-specific [Trinickia sp.]|uniref:phosphocholine-specific phospholipase C n=1 Tax=Trinickia sp. TaxID=2571163 RepID=UPI002C942EE4|nr:phospholipase C, phosphocholine-specific [Trinickia sp.]HTI18002.1 phospholipase C, phosphocholine-specific [Trinickia sp.]
MNSITRRAFLRAAAQAAGAAAMGILPAGIRNALAIPAYDATRSIEDVEHIVILMQENRSFDHYFGTLRGVRGYGDRRVITLPSGNPVWFQPLVAGVGQILPFRPSASNLGMQFMQGMLHDWSTTHWAWNGGRYDQWIAAKGPTTMAYMTRDDIPFHYQLADAFTICDAYHCSIMSSTDPNRYYLWTGGIGNDCTGGGPAIDNAERGYSWTTYPELLQAANISWKVYQDIGAGLDANGAWGGSEDAYIGNYGDNALLYFDQYRNAQPGDALYDNARTGTNVAVSGGYFDVLKRDVQNGALPQVSWIVAPEAYSEHPNWPPNYGAWYIDQVLQVLTSNPAVWSKTALFVTYDENDGFFDHVAPPFAPWSDATGRSSVDTTNEFFGGGPGKMAGPYGLGPRVPMIVVSPWSKGGWVCSETFDHTSIIRFIERRFAGKAVLREADITRWRRSICGDLTRAFDFANPNVTVPPLPSTEGYVPPDRQRHFSYFALPPLAQTLPSQEPGLRPARALPYELFVLGRARRDEGVLSLEWVNNGDVGAAFLVYRLTSGDPPRAYTVGAKERFDDPLALDADGSYRYAIHGPNGFLRRFKGKAVHVRWWGSDVAVPEVTEVYDVANGCIEVRLHNLGTSACVFSIVNGYDGARIERSVAGGNVADVYFDLRPSYSWYDLRISVDTDPLFERALAGHVETGRSSMSDPAFGTA